MWFCPTYQRPDGLKRLADSWVKFEAETPLAVRLWEKDPKLEEYQKQEWPANWEFYLSDTEYFSSAANEFFAKHSDAATYGFIADDVELVAPGGLEHLDALAAPFFIAYPNDTIHRDRQPTHYSIGGDLVRTLGWFAPPFLRHQYTDDVWKLLGKACGLLRYAPQVIFYHHHLLKHRAPCDAGYAKCYDENGQMTGKLSVIDNNAFTNYINGAAFRMDVKLLRESLLWVENQIRKEAGFDEETVYSYAEQSLLPPRDVSGAVGGRERAGEVQELYGESGRVSGGGAPGDAAGAARGNGVGAATGTGFPEGRGSFAVKERVYRYPDANVVVGIPSGGEWAAQMGTSLALLVTDFMQQGLPGLRSRQLHLHSAESSMLVSNRHSAVRNMLQSNASHLLFVDSDMKFPPWALRQLMQHDLPFVAANCTKRAFPVEGTALDFEGKPVDSVNGRGLEKVRQVGLAFALIRREVFEELRPPLFMMEWVEELKGYCGEDIYFSQLLQQAGVDVWIDHDLSREIGHIGSLTFGHGQVGTASPQEWLCRAA